MMTVKPGDTLSGIAQQQGVSTQSMVKANPQLQNPNLIYAGDKLRMPGGGAPASGQTGPAGGPAPAGQPGGAVDRKSVV